LQSVFKVRIPCQAVRSGAMQSGCDVGDVSITVCDVCGMQTPSAPASLIKMEERTTH